CGCCCCRRRCCYCCCYCCSCCRCCFLPAKPRSMMLSHSPVPAVQPLILPVPRPRGQQLIAGRPQPCSWRRCARPESEAFSASARAAAVLGGATVAAFRCRRRCIQLERGASKSAADSSGGAATSLRRREAALVPTLCGLLMVSRPGTAVAKELAQLGQLGNGTLNVQLPEAFTWAEKSILLPTHVYEKRASAKDPYGKWTIGLSIDDVLANSLTEVGTAAQIADRIANLERGKDGNFETQVLSASRGDLDGIPCDLIEYKADTSRGFYHYLVRVALVKGKLYEVTSQALEGQWPDLQEAARASLATMRLNL
ncbi:unnamed protein product, partial [Polarella glacialis]